jgi:hypothetical protein
MRNAVLAVLIVILSFAPQTVAAGTSSEVSVVRLTVSVFNDAGASPSVMSQARNRATLILRRAGISLVWLACRTPGNPPTNSTCSDLSFPQHLSVRLVSTAGRPSEDTFGQTFQNAAGEGNYALVYFNILAASSVIESVHAGDLVGLVIAHELGHLLLGRDSHSATGLMAPVWQASEVRMASKGILFFNNDQQDRIRLRCLAAQASFKKTAWAPLAGSGK